MRWHIRMKHNHRDSSHFENFCIVLSHSGNQLHFLSHVFNKCDIGWFSSHTRAFLYRGSSPCFVTDEISYWGTSRYLKINQTFAHSHPLATIFSFIGDTWCLIKFLAILKFLINGAQSSPILFCSAEEKSKIFFGTWTFRQPFYPTNLFRWHEILKTERREAGAGNEHEKDEVVWNVLFCV